MISIVIPTLNAAATLGGTLAALFFPDDTDLVAEIIVSDGGSVDATRDVAGDAGCRIIDGERGRGAQLRRGAAAARGSWLLFLHADTRLETNWQRSVQTFIAAADAPCHAAVFTFALDDPSRRARWLERIVAARVKLLALPYGDQGLIMSRALYEQLGGYRPLPLMEDVDLIRRLGRRRLAVLPARAVTSAARYRRDGFMPRILRNAACLSLYVVGVPPRLIARLYE